MNHVCNILCIHLAEREKGDIRVHYRWERAIPFSVPRSLDSPALASPLHMLLLTEASALSQW